MKTLTLLMIILVFTGGCKMEQSTNSTSNGSDFYSQKINSIDGKPMDLKSLTGNPVLVVNIATQCGYTKQLSGLENLFKTYKDKGLKVIGIPSNDFGGQTPEEAKKVKDFCALNYGVTFPITEKTKITDATHDSLAHWLISSSEEKSAVKWNFEKFLINKNGKIVKRYKSSVKPDDENLINDIKVTL